MGEFSRRFGMPLKEYLKLSTEEQREVRFNAGYSPDPSLWIETAYESGDENLIKAAKEAIEKMFKLIQEKG